MVAAEAYDVCRQIARRHYENFPVASRLVPGRLRPHITAVYAFARIADDFADEGARPADERLERLDDWRRRLHEAVDGPPADPPPGDDAERTACAVFTALADTIRARALDVALFDDLLSAFRQDVLVSRYSTWADVFDYCRRSANPVGRLVLRIAQVASPELDALSDAICTALQLTNFWQDVERDWRIGRLYVPREVLDAAGARESDLDARTMTPAWRTALDRAAKRTRELFDRGHALPDRLRGRLRWELRATWLGGVRILERLERGGFDVFQDRPALGWTDAVLIGWRTFAWR